VNFQKRFGKTTLTKKSVKHEETSIIINHPILYEVNVYLRL